MTRRLVFFSFELDREVCKVDGVHEDSLPSEKLLGMGTETFLAVE